MKNSQQSNQFPVRPKATVFELTYRGQSICKGNSGLCFGQKANLIKTGNYTPSLFIIRTVT